MNALRSYAATLIVLVSTIVLVVFIKLFFKNVLESSKRWPYQRQLLVFLIVLVGLFFSIAFLPIDHEVKNQILSVLGILLSAIIALSSTTLVGNAMAGIMLRITHEFRGGDFIEFDSMIGRVTDLGIFHTEIQRITRDMVSIPNLLLVQKAVQVTKRDGSFINLAVSIGYTVDRTMVEEALKEAAKRCELKDSFVFIEAFLDHAIQYRLYGLLEATSERLSKTSELHKMVLDVFNEQGIEIASPSLMDRRELENSALYLPKQLKRQQKQEEKEAIESLAFDKAEEAESIEQLKSSQELLSKSIETMDKEQKQRAEEKIEAIGEEIQKREEKQKELS